MPIYHLEHVHTIIAMARYRNLPIATISLIVINVLIFVLGFVTDSHTQIIRDYGFIPDSIFNTDNSQTDYNIPTGHEAIGNSAYSNLVRLFSSMFIHVNIAHIAFNLLALAYIGGGEVNWILKVCCDLFPIWNICSLVSWGYRILPSRQRTNFVNRGIRGYIWNIRDSGSHGESESILLAYISDSLCIHRFSFLNPYSFYCAYWRVLGWRNTNQILSQEGR